MAEVTYADGDHTNEKQKKIQLFLKLRLTLVI